jgi:enoyl-CoA hydratase/carnithine racemase
MSKYTFLKTAQHERVAHIEIHRPAQRNALNPELVQELEAALMAADQDPGTSVIVLSGNEKAFAAGADIGRMAEWDFHDVFLSDYVTRHWESARTLRKPLIAAICGYAIGGGCELAMMCDVVVAGVSAQVRPTRSQDRDFARHGRHQRLPRAIGKAKAMEWCLSGNFYSAAEAEKAGLVSRVVADEAVLDTAFELAQQMAGYSLPVLMMIKESLGRAFESACPKGCCSSGGSFTPVLRCKTKRKA